MRWLSDHISNIKSRVWQQARILVLEQISAETYDRPFFSMLTAPLDRKPIRKVKVIGAFSSTRNVPLLSKANLGRIALALVIPVILPYICSVKMDSQLK